jgi:hypothetical protein
LGRGFEALIRNIHNSRKSFVELPIITVTEDATISSNNSGKPNSGRQLIINYVIQKFIIIKYCEPVGKKNFRFHLIFSLHGNLTKNIKLKN